MLTINAADDFGRPTQWTYTSTNAAAVNPMSVTLNPGWVNATTTGVYWRQPEVPWLRVDRIPTVPITRTVAAGGNPCITYIFPFEEHA